MTGIALAAALLSAGACGGERRMGEHVDGGAAGSDGAAPIDAGPGLDGGGSLDGGGGSDGGGGATDAGPDCDPEPGSESVGAYCDLFELAVIDDGAGAVRARLTGRVGPDGVPDGSCAVVDEVEVREGDTTIGTLDGGGPFTTHDQYAVIAQDTALPEMISRCDGDADRFGGFGLIIRGRMDGGTFEARCADAEGGSRWPPALVITCHENVDEPPFGAYTSVDSYGAFTYSTVDVTVPHGSGGALTSVDGTIRVIPHADSWSSVVVPDPFDVTGMDGSVHEGSAPLPGTYTQLLLSKDEDIFGTDLCPPPDTGEPGPAYEPPPVMLIRVTGTSERGPYSTEALADYCTRTGA